MAAQRMTRQKDPQLPAGRDADRVRRVAESYDGQSDDDAIAEHEVALGTPRETLIEVPVALLPTVRELIAEYERDHPDA